MAGPSSRTSSSSSSSIPSCHSPLPPLTSVFTSLSSSRFSSWYPSLRKISPKATIIDVASLQLDFFQWLEEDGLILPRGSGAGVVGGEEEDEDEADDDDGSASEDGLQARNFSVLDERIRQVIEKYDGAVFPKLDWSAPRDAAWILPGQTLKCTTPADVYLLLKSSDFVGKDLTQRDEVNKMTSEQNSAGDDFDTLTLSAAVEEAGTATQPTALSPRNLQLNLILKRHFTVAPSHEFRCFVRGGHFVAICQRDGTYYDFLQSEGTRKEIRLKLLNFWQQNLKGAIRKHDGSGAIDSASQDTTREALQDYIWDAYFNRDRSKVFLMDVNPYLPRTDALSWDWEELETLAERAWHRDHNSSAIMSSNGHAAPSPQKPAYRSLESRVQSKADREDDEEGTDTGDSATSSEEQDSPPDPRGEAFIRIYTDGQAPTTHYRPWSPTSNPAPLPFDVSASCSHRAQGRQRPSRHHRLLPPLRLLTSQAQASQSFPTYASNMIPRDVVDVSNGNGMEEFARMWKSELEQDCR